MRHELDIAAIQAAPILELPALYETLSTMIAVGEGGIRGGHCRTEDLSEATNDFLEGILDHLGDLREAVVRSMEDRRPSTMEEARERTRLLLMANIGAGATIEEAVARLDQDFREPEPTRS